MRQWLQWLRTGVVMSTHLSLLPYELYVGAAPFGALNYMMYAALIGCFLTAKKARSTAAATEEEKEKKAPGSVWVFVALGAAATIIVTGPYCIFTAPTYTLMALRALAWMPFGGVVHALYKLLDPRLEFTVSASVAVPPTETQE
jgi:hypothetical protein